jgi:hypothetical protein
MGKVKKKFKKKINPERSNKMIIAVVVGVVIVFAALFVVMVGDESVGDKNEVMNDALEYLKKGEGISELKILPQQNKVVIVYDENNTDMDFKKIARYAGIKLSNKIKNEEVYIALSGNKDKQGREIYTVVLKNGRVTAIRE